MFRTQIVMLIALGLFGGMPSRFQSRCHAQSAGDSPVLVQEVLNAWKTREDRIGSARFTWKRTIQDEHLFSQIGEKRQQLSGEDEYECAFNSSRLIVRIPGGTPDPFFKASSRISGINHREARKNHLGEFLKEFSQSGTEPPTSSPFYTQSRLLTSACATELWIPTGESRGSPKVWIYDIPHQAERTVGMNLWFQFSGETTENIATLFAQAPLIALQPLHSLWGEKEVSACHLLPETRTIAGRDCHVFQETLGSQANMRSYWVDPQREFAILRYQGIEDFRLSVQLDFEYEDHPTLGPVPVSWTTVQFRSSTSTIRSFASTRDVQFELHVPDKVIPEQLTFPPGTWVVDETSQQQWLVQEGSRKQSIESSANDSQGTEGSYEWEDRSQRLYTQWRQQQKDQAELQHFGTILLGALLTVGLLFLAWWASQRLFIKEKRHQIISR